MWAIKDNKINKAMFEKKATNTFQFNQMEVKCAQIFQNKLEIQIEDIVVLYKIEKKTKIFKKKDVATL